LITRTTDYTEPDPAKITVTPLHGDSQTITLLLQEIVCMERFAENERFTHIQCTSKRQYLVRENLTEITTQLETHQPAL
jgi:hypothetical protein